MPFLPVQDIVRANCGITDNDTPKEIGERVRVALTEMKRERFDHDGILRNPFFDRLFDFPRSR